MRWMHTCNRNVHVTLLTCLSHLHNLSATPTRRIQTSLYYSKLQLLALIHKEVNRILLLQWCRISHSVHTLTSLLKMITKLPSPSEDHHSPCPCRIRSWWERTPHLLRLSSLIAQILNALHQSLHHSQTISETTQSHHLLPALLQLRLHLLLPHLPLQPQVTGIDLQTSITWPLQRFHNTPSMIQIMRPSSHSHPNQSHQQRHVNLCLNNRMQDFQAVPLLPILCVYPIARLHK